MNTKTKILIVDDEEVVRHSFMRILGTTSHQVKAVASWTEVVQAMQADPFDVVLLDLRMPDVDGMTVLRGLKQRWPDCEVVVVTGYPSIETAKEAVALGAYDYLAKPIGPEQVIDASNAAMRHKRWALHADAGVAQDKSGSHAGVAALPDQPVNFRSES
jgi:DNA-binding NtrC family response regulator